MAAQRGFDRLVNLSDAVVAIAATLLVLPLVDSASEISGTTVGALLAEHWEELLAFGLSFAVICRFRLVHHSMFTRVTGFTPALVWANFLWLLTVRTPGIQAEDVRGTLHVRGAVVATATMAVVLLVVALVPHVGLFALLLLIPSGVIEARIGRRTRAGLDPAL